MRRIAACGGGLFVFVCVSLLWCGSAAQAEAISLSDYMYRLGNVEDCYFTLEEAHAVGEPMNLLSSQLIAWNEHASSLQQHLDYLCASVKGLRVIQSSDAPCVIHFMDLRLVDLKKYPLNVHLNEITYSGRFRNVLPTLSKNVGEISLIDGGPMGWPLDFLDCDTPIVRISKAHDVEVREALSNYLPIANSNRVIWVAQIRLNDPTRVKVGFLGRIVPQVAQTNAITAMRPMLSAGSTGFDDYVARRHAEINAVIAFVKEKGTKAQRNSQLRWAIRMLGEMRGEESVSLLMEYLDWQYSDYGVVEESFPAVYSLARIGAPAVTAIAKALPGEENALRIRLMCNVMSMVEGTERAVQVVQEIIDKTQDPQEKMNLNAALADLENLKTMDGATE